MTTQHARLALLLAWPLMAVPCIYLLSNQSTAPEPPAAPVAPPPPLELSAARVATEWTEPRVEPLPAVPPLEDFVMVPEAQNPLPLPPPPLPPAEPALPLLAARPEPAPEPKSPPPPPLPEPMPEPKPVPNSEPPSPALLPVTPPPPIPEPMAEPVPMPVAQPEPPPRPMLKVEEPVAPAPMPVPLPRPEPVQRTSVTVEPLPPVRVQELAKARSLPLTGTVLARLDNEHRLALPAIIRDQLGDATLLVSPGAEDCLWLTTPAHLQRIQERHDQARMRQGDVRAFKRLYFSQAEKVTVNGEGRLVLPERLSQFAGLCGDVVIVGADDHFEVWDAARWRTRQNDLPRDDDE
jgi:division/cell wall cluster transcriptional repressor MraZ